MSDAQNGHFERPDNEISAAGQITGAVMFGPALNWLKEHCPAPAPLVVNGSPYVGCSREKGHDGDHEVTVRWPS